ncbi:MAG: hypothetical protein GY786_24020, partial [Proteobacteria bacterium]|nr:hypothetical protein [Pseudomonadota bacterium]
QETAVLKEDLLKLGASAKKGIALAVWDVNNQQVDLIIEGLLEIPFVMGVNIKDLNNEKLYGKSGNVEHNYKLSHFNDIDQTLNKIGDMVVYSDTSIIYARVKNSYISIIANAIIKTIAIWIIVLFVGKRLISRPLTILKEASQSVDLDNIETCREVDIGLNQHQNELTILADTFNLMLSNLIQSRHELDKINQNLENKIEERTEELSIAKEKAEDALKKTNAAYENLKLTQANLVQSAKMASLGELVAGIAHEVNTPLGVGVTGASLIREDVKSLSNASRDGELTEEHFIQALSSITETSAVILSNLKRAANLISSFKQISGDQHHEESRKFQIKEYMSNIIETLSPKLKKGEYSIKLNCDPMLSISSAPGYFYQILSNLIINSIDHGFEGKNKGEITLTIEQIDKSIVFLYRDNGKGISKEKITKVFDPFYTTKRGSGNTGLGMHIVYNLVIQNLGGDISCSSTPGSGIEFKIVLPADPEEPG